MLSRANVGDDMSAVVTGLIGAVAAVAVVMLAERTQKPAIMRSGGWTALRPSWLLHGCMILCIGFGALMIYFLLSGGSSRPDASTQNMFALMLLAVAAAGAVYGGWTSYGRKIMWKGNELRIRSPLGREVLQRLSDVVEVTKSETRGEYRVTFRDGSKFWFSAHMHGANDLVARLPQRTFATDF
jgi:hypothetical protein